MIRCQECGKKISDKATTCPKCGCPVCTINEQDANIMEMNKEKPFKLKNKRSKKIIIGTVCCIVLLIALNYMFPRFKWDEVKISTTLPRTESQWGELSSNRDDYLCLYVHQISSDEYSQYLEDCKEEGFNLDVVLDEHSYQACNNEGYQLELYYFTNDKEMRISVDAPMEMMKIQWSTSAIAQILPVPEFEEGYVKEDDDKMYEVYLRSISKEAMESYM